MPHTASAPFLVCALSLRRAHVIDDHSRRAAAQSIRFLEAGPMDNRHSSAAAETHRRLWSDNRTLGNISLY